MTTIGVISDTHIKIGGKHQIPPEVYAAFANVDLILHAGDLNTLQVVSDLEVLAPVLAVYGNNCDWDAVHQLPQTREFQIEGVKIGLAHGDIGSASALRSSSTRFLALSHFPDADCVVFGHSHRPLIDWLEIADSSNSPKKTRRVLLFNPGSPTKKRGAPQHSCRILRIDGENIEPQLILW